MILKNNKGWEMEVSEIDKDNEICFEIEGCDSSSNAIVWISVDDNIKLIGFLQEQLEIFNNKPLT